MQSQKLELQTRIKVAEKNLGKRHFSGDNVIGDLQRISDEIKRAEGLMELDRQRFEIARMQRHRLAVIAPFTGTLLQLPRVNNGQVKAGETIALFEKNDQRAVTAFLTQDEVLQIEMGSDVDIYIPATGEVVPARIVDIDRTMGFFRQASTRSPMKLQWRTSRERTARVVLAFNNPRAFANNRQYRAGLPVIANFQRKSGGYITARAKKLVRQAWSQIPELPNSVRQTYTEFVSYLHGTDKPIRLRYGPVPATEREKPKKPYLQIEAEGPNTPDGRPRLEAIANGFRFDPGNIIRQTAKAGRIGPTE